MGCFTTRASSRSRLERWRCASPFRDLDDYEQWVIDVAGPLAIVVRGLPPDERDVLKTRLAGAFIPFASGDGYELPGEALCAVAR